MVVCIIVFVRYCTVFWSFVMATTPVASSVDVLSSVERSLVIEGLQLRIAQIRRAMNSERDETILSVRNGQIASLETLVSKFR